jgi:hypothetical protein
MPASGPGRDEWGEPRRVEPEGGEGFLGPIRGFIAAFGKHGDRLAGKGVYQAFGPGQHPTGPAEIGGEEAGVRQDARDEQEGPAPAEAGGSASGGRRRSIKARGPGAVWPDRNDRRPVPEIAIADISALASPILSEETAEARASAQSSTDRAYSRSIGGIARATRRGPRPRR